jgi:hypothetical protein
VDICFQCPYFSIGPALEAKNGYLNTVPPQNDLADLVGQLLGEPSGSGLVAWGVPGGAVGVGDALDDDLFGKFGR